MAQKNRYVFAAPTKHSSNHLRGNNDCLGAVVKKVKKQYALKYADSIQSIKLRKYIAVSY